MRRMILIASALCLALPPNAIAQPGPPGGGGPPSSSQGRSPGQGRPQQNRPPQSQGRPPGGGSSQGRPSGPSQGGRPPQGSRPPQNSRPPSSRPPSSRPPPSHSRPPPSRGRPPPPRGPGWNFSSPNPWRAPRANQWYWHGRWMGRTHAPPFRYPPGFGYRRWSAGMLLPAAFLTSAFFWDSYGRVGLPAPPVGARWVRYGPDLVLVEVPSGRVLEVAYGVFL